MEHEKTSKVFGGTSVIGGDENTLFRETVNNDKDCVEAIGVGESFDEVHGDGVPRTWRNRELLECAVGFMSLRFGSHTGSTRFAVLLDEGTHVGPNVVLSDGVECLVNSGVSCKNVVMCVLEDPEAEIAGVRYVDAIVEAYKSIVGGRPTTVVRVVRD